MNNYKMISDRSYNFIIGLTLLWGFVINYLMIQLIPVSVITSINPIIFIIGYFVVCLAGIYLFTNSDDPLFSFLGYNLVVIPFGLCINLVVGRYEPAVVMNAIITTGAVSFIMMVLGTMFPDFFEKIGTILFISLISVIIIELLSILVFHADPSWIDWVVAIIFCGYIGYDWHKASMKQKTVDNAIDSAAAIYMDIINLFIRILEIMGKKK